MRGINSFYQQEIVQQVQPDRQKESGQQPVPDPPASPMRKKKTAREQQLKDHHHKKDIREAKAHGSNIGGFS
jgi:hypothetical protein